MALFKKKSKVYFVQSFVAFHLTNTFNRVILYSQSVPLFGLLPRDLSVCTSLSSCLELRMMHAGWNCRKTASILTQKKIIIQYVLKCIMFEYHQHRTKNRLLITLTSYFSSEIENHPTLQCLTAERPVSTRCHSTPCPVCHYAREGTCKSTK